MTLLPCGFDGNDRTYGLVNIEFFEGRQVFVTLWVSYFSALKFRHGLMWDLTALTEMLAFVSKTLLPLKC